MYFYKDGSNWILGETVLDLIPSGTYRLKPVSGNIVHLISLTPEQENILNLDVTTVKKNSNGDFYTNITDFAGVVKDFFVKASGVGGSTLIHKAILSAKSNNGAFLKNSEIINKDDENYLDGLWQITDIQNPGVWYVYIKGLKPNRASVKISQPEGAATGLIPMADTSMEGTICITFGNPNGPNYNNHFNKINIEIEVRVSDIIQSSGSGSGSGSGSDGAGVGGEVLSEWANAYEFVLDRFDAVMDIPTYTKLIISSLGNIKLVNSNPGISCNYINFIISNGNSIRSIMLETPLIPDTIIGNFCNIFEITVDMISDFINNRVFDEIELIHAYEDAYAGLKITFLNPYVNWSMYDVQRFYFDALEGIDLPGCGNLVIEQRGDIIRLINTPSSAIEFDTIELLKSSGKDTLSNKIFTSGNNYITKILQYTDDIIRIKLIKSENYALVFKNQKYIIPNNSRRFILIYNDPTPYYPQINFSDLITAFPTLGITDDGRLFFDGYQNQQPASIYNMLMTRIEIIGSILAEAYQVLDIALDDNKDLTQLNRFLFDGVPDEQSLFQYQINIWVTDGNQTNILSFQNYNMGG